MINAGTVLPIVSFALSVIVTAVTVGITIGIFKTKILECEKDVNGIGKKIDAEIAQLKDDYLKPLSDRMTESEADRRGLSETMNRIEACMHSIEKRLDKIEENIARRT